MHNPGDIINKRYQILDELGKGGLRSIYVAEELPTGKKVVIKSLQFKNTLNWKAIDLFEREAKILSKLDHPNIPKCIDYFQFDAGENNSFYIIQQLIEGSSLEALMANGWQPTEVEVKKIAVQALQVLIYLQSLIPPVIHRDIKPQNFILHPNGQVFLVDFGAVRDTYKDTITGGSTIIGTYGYMAPEQFRGHAKLSTDLYGLGMTLIFLLTNDSPSKLPRRNLRINFRPYVSVSQTFASWLEILIEPLLEKRFPNALIALNILQGKKEASDIGNKIFQRLRVGNNLKIIRDEEELIIKLPAPILTRNLSVFMTEVLMLSCLFVWTCFFVAVSYKMGLLAFFSGLFVPVIVGIVYLSFFAIQALTRFELHISNKTSKKSKRERTLGKSLFDSVFLASTDIEKAKILNSFPFSTCAISFQDNSRKDQQTYLLKFGWLLSLEEKKLMVVMINDFINH
jgi:serine/threonine protein kinase